jgi:AcrR family transcriptional regulator
MAKAKANKRTQVDPTHVRGRILDAFSAKAKRVGIRTIMMAELASELRMSASTLYKLFPSKEALALACVERWVDELAAAESARRDPEAPRPGFEQFMHWLDAWASANATLSPAFVHDLQSDYPAAWQRFREIAQERSLRGAELVKPLLKSELDSGVALAVLDLIVTAVQRPEFAERLGITRQVAMRSAVSIWASGAIDRRGKLRPLRTTKKD